MSVADLYLFVFGRLGLRLSTGTRNFPNFYRHTLSIANLPATMSAITRDHVRGSEVRPGINTAGMRKLRPMSLLDGGLSRSTQHFILKRKDGVLMMSQRYHRGFTAAEKTQLWVRRLLMWGR
jgi:hypothetical protein